MPERGPLTTGSSYANATGGAASRMCGGAGGGGPCSSIPVTLYRSGKVKQRGSGGIVR